MKSLYPSIVHNKELCFEVGDGHTLYGREYGNPDGIPAVFLHGGPGSGCESYHARFFDPQRYRIILFDQRGAGRSVPHAAIHANTTQHLIDDMEYIRQSLNIEKWLIFGGSWGSTLALAYAQMHGERVLALVLRGIFLCRDIDIQWFYQAGASYLFPDYWTEYYEHIPAEERDDMVAAYHRRLTGDDEIARMAAAKVWSLWEGRCSTLRSNPSVQGHFSDVRTALSLARIECHYFYHRCWLEPSQLLNNAHLLQGIPGKIIHGRYDIVCPITQAYELQKAWPEAELDIMPVAGHSASEPSIAEALVRTTNYFAKLLG